MSLAAFATVSEQIEAGDTTLELGGLSLADLAYLSKEWGTPLAGMLDGNLGSDSLSALIETAPAFVAEVIVRSAARAGTSGTVAEVLEWPAGLQLRALEATWRGTQLDTDALGNWLRRAIAAAPTLRAAVDGSETPSPSPLSNSSESLSTTSSAPATDSVKPSISRSRKPPPAADLQNGASEGDWQDTQAPPARQSGRTRVNTPSSSTH